MKIDSKEFIKTINKLTDNLSDKEIEKINKRVSARLLQITKATFIKQQSPFKKNWRKSEAAIKRAGQTLRDSGRLLNSIFTDSNEYSVRIFAAGISYADAHNSGFNETVKVRQHKRTITQAFGQPIQPRVVTVKSHSRLMNIEQRMFIANEGRLPESYISAIQEEYTRNLHRDIQ